MIAATIPVTISDEAKARVEDLGLRHEFEMMLEHARKTIPGLRSVNVSLDWSPEFPGGSKILLDAHRPHLGDGERAAQKAWMEWELDTFPPHILVYFTLLPFYEEANER